MTAPHTVAGHTAGPWEARTFMVLGGVGLHDRITHVGGNLPPTRVEEAVANARLIAAAPDLLAALVALVPADFDEHPGDFTEEWHAARAAIAKATAARQSGEDS